MNKKHAIRALKHAKRNLALYSQYVCCHISDYADQVQGKESKYAYDTVETLRGWISTQIGEANTFTSALSCEYNLRIEPYSHEALRLRSEWIDLMIEAIEKNVMAGKNDPFKRIVKKLKKSREKS